MTELFDRFGLQYFKTSPQVLGIMILLWTLVLCCGIASILGQPFSNRQRVFWIVVIICVPLIGLLAYLPFSFRKEEMPHIFLAKAKRKKPRRGEDLQKN